MVDLSTNLIVSGEPLQGLYSQYRAGLLTVNRRYQRKLVWSISEKEKFVDSLLKDLPVPLVLVAEVNGPDGRRLEIIDGLQRLNSIFAFMEGEFPRDGRFFALESLAETKALMDDGSLQQRTPTLDRDSCVRLSGYRLPVSTYRASNNAEVEEVFRRINSNGRHLSRQEIRQAGCLTRLSDVVRSVSASTRGDYSITDTVDLRHMPEISISSTPSAPGVYVEDIPWIQQGILDREQVRSSRDEEIVADLLVSILAENLPPFDSRVLDEFYGLIDSKESRSTRMDSIIVRDGIESVQARFRYVWSVFERLFPVDSLPFSSHFFQMRRQRVPRYFECVFLALDQLIFGEQRELIDILGAREALKDFGSLHLSIPSGGGTWTANSKKRNINLVVGILRSHSEPRSGVRDPLLERPALEVENLLRASLVENSLFELKQGTCRLSERPLPDGAVVEDVVRTLTAMANSGPDTKGYCLVGIADKKSDALRVSKLSGEPLVNHSGRFVTGLSLDSSCHGSLDDFLLWFTQKMMATAAPQEFLNDISRDMRVVQVAERQVLLMPVRSGSRPAPFGEDFYTRVGSKTQRVGAANLANLFSRFQGSGAGQ